MYEQISHTTRFLFLSVSLKKVVMNGGVRGEIHFLVRCTLFVSSWESVIKEMSVLLLKMMCILRLEIRWNFLSKYSQSCLRNTPTCCWSMNLKRKMTLHSNHHFLFRAFHNKIILLFAPYTLTFALKRLLNDYCTFYRTFVFVIFSVSFSLWL
jgi:hypothetical protein